MSAHWADKYKAAGRILLPIPAGTKRATDPEWADPARTDFAIREGDNVAWRLDDLGDLDVDHPVAVIVCALLAPILLPPTAAVSGRASVGWPSHRFWRSPGAKYKKFSLPSIGTILELRAGAGHYTLVPPSILPPGRGDVPAGEARWYGPDPGGPPADADPEVLARGAGICAAASALAIALGRHGYGHDARLEVAGILLRCGLSIDEAVAIGEAISVPCENTEIGDVRVATVTTASRLEAGAHATGAPSLAKRLGSSGKDILLAVQDWLGRTRAETPVVIEGVPPLTETGDAEHFAALNADGARHDWRRGKWVVWRAPAWRLQTDGEVERLTLEAIRDRQVQALALVNEDARRAVLKWTLSGESRARRSSMADLARSIRPLADRGDAWDPAPMLMAFQDEVVDLATAEARPGLPGDRVTMLARCEWAGGKATAPLWEQTVAQVFGDDPDLMAYFQRAVGYSLTGDCREEILVVCYGDGANGKALSINTPVLTPTGWTTQGTLRPGDFVIDGEGKPTKVLAVTKPWVSAECYRLSFSDGTSIIADAAHKWVVNANNRPTPRILTTKEIFGSGVIKRSRMRSVGSRSSLMHEARWEICLPPPLDFHAAVPRKLSQLRPNTYRCVVKIRSCEPVEPTTVCCIQIEAPSSLYLVGEGMIPTHNSTLVNTLGWALGDYADDLPFSTFEAGSRSSIPNDVAKIAGKRFVTSSETGEATRLNEARVKAFTGRDPITARFLHHEFFTFQPDAKFWLSINHKPEVHDDSAGFWRRIHLLPFEQSFVGREDKTLKDRLRLEMPGVMAWAVRGAIEWARDGLRPPAKVLAAAKEWQAESDILAPFLADRCVIADGARCQASTAYAEYERWRKDHGIKDSLTLKAFGMRMRKTFRVEAGRHVIYLGIGLRANIDEGDL